MLKRHAQLYCDHVSSHRLFKEPMGSDRTRHTEIRHKNIQQLVDQNRLSVSWTQVIIYIYRCCRLDTIFLYLVGHP